MVGIITILVFSALISWPIFYIISRAMFPKTSKKKLMTVSALLTLLLLAIFTISLLALL